MKLNFIVLAIFLGLIISSCTKDDSQLYEAGKNNSDQELSKSMTSNKTYWSNRLTSYDSITMTASMREMIDSLKIEVSTNYSVTNYRLRDIGLQMSQEISEEYFVDLFVSKDEPKFSTIPYESNGCLECRDRLNQWYSEPVGAYDSNLPDCNCNWTCGGPLAECTTSNCNETNHGCGFLWAFPCAEHDSLYPC